MEELARMQKVLCDAIVKGQPEDRRQVVSLITDIADLIANSLTGPVKIDKLVQLADKLDQVLKQTTTSACVDLLQILKLQLSSFIDERYQADARTQLVLKLNQANRVLDQIPSQAFVYPLVSASTQLIKHIESSSWDYLVDEILDLNGNLSKTMVNTNNQQFVANLTQAHKIIAEALGFAASYAKIQDSQAVNLIKMNVKFADLIASPLDSPTEQEFVKIHRKNYQMLGEFAKLFQSMSATNGSEILPRMFGLLHLVASSLERPFPENQSDFLRVNAELAEILKKDGANREKQGQTVKDSSGCVNGGNPTANLDDKAAMNESLPSPGGQEIMISRDNPSGGSYGGNPAVASTPEKNRGAADLSDSPDLQSPVLVRSAMALNLTPERVVIVSPMATVPEDVELLSPAKSSDAGSDGAGGSPFFRKKEHRFTKKRNTVPTMSP